MPRYLVLGASGFLGGHVVSQLEERGITVVGLSRSAKHNPATHRHTANLFDSDDLSHAMDDCDGVFHCAGSVSRNPNDAEALYEAHVVATKNVLDAARISGVKRLVFTSSSGTIAVSKDKNYVGRETDNAPIATISRWPYYRAKLFAEQAALAANSPKLAVVSVNPSLLLGPGDPSGRSTDDVRALIEGKIPAMPAGGIAFVDVRDTASALIAAMERGRAGEKYLISGQNMTFAAFFSQVARLAGVNAPWLTMPKIDNARELAEWLEAITRRLGIPKIIDPVSLEMAQYYWYVDSSKAESELDFRPRDPLITLSDTIADMRKRGIVWPK